MSTIFGSPSESTTRWHPSPNERGTWDILTTCILTISLCVWTALHLNVPAAEDGSLSKFVKMAGWLVVGLLAPEILVYLAWYQRREAGILTAKIQEVLGQGPAKSGLTRWSSQKAATVELDDLNVQEAQSMPGRAPQGASEGKTHDTDRRSWTLAHSFYALMGGYGFRLSASQNKLLPNSASPTMRFTPAAMAMLHDRYPEFVPNLTEADIKDRSKADNFAKTISCIQALWFCIQCISRLAQRIPITLLELNVFGHAIGALLTYVFWWHKPLDIDNTVCISLVETGPGVPLWFPLREFIQEELIVAFAAKEVRILGTKDKKGIPGVEAANNGKTLCEDTEYVMCAPDMLSPDQAWGTPKFNVPFGDLNKVKTTIRAVDQGRLTSRNANLDFDPRIAVHRCSMKPTTGNLQSNSFCDPDTRYRGALGRGQATLFWGLLILVSALYGGLHLVAWNAPFASRTQQLLWRISATTVTVSGLPIAIATAAPRNVVKTMVNRNCCALCLYCPILYMWLNLQGALMLSWLLIAFYVFARGYLVVECFISLFHASPGVFNMPNWAAYVPHIS